MSWIEDILLPPHDYELEKLGLSMICDNIVNLDLLDENCFYTSTYKKIYKAIKTSLSTDFTVLVVATGLTNDDVLDATTQLVSKDSIDYITTQLHKYKNARILINWIRNLENQARWLDIDKAKDTIQKLDLIIQDIAKEKSTEDYAMDYFDDIGKIKKEIKTWYKMIDEYVNLLWWQLVVIAGRPSMWKTTVMLNFALRQAVERNVWFISMEMQVFELFDRMICILWCLSSYEIKDKRNNIDKIQTYLSSIMEKKLFIAENIYSLSKVEQYIVKNWLDICYIDYLWLIQYWDAKMRTIDRISEITRQLKLIAKKHNCHIVLGCQLSRSVEWRIDKKPLLPDLRDSWSIEQDADIVIMLHREEYYDKDTDQKNKIDILIRKQRNWEQKEIILDTKFSSYRIIDTWYAKKL